MAKHPGTASAPSSIDTLIDAVLADLEKTPKEISSVWFYDELGSLLFDSICELPEYYITRTELQIMRTHAADMARIIGGGAALIELGSGTSLKTRQLLDHLQTPHTYVPVDVSRRQLLDACRHLAHDYPRLRITPVCADFSRDFKLPSDILSARKRIIYFPGSTFGNFTHAQARHLLARLLAIIRANGSILIGIDLCKDIGILKQAYDDPVGVTAKFNINALRHINRELGADFELKNFDHAALWIDDQSRMEMHLVSKRDQIVHLGGRGVRIAYGEHLRTEYCHKYTQDSFEQFALETGLVITHAWHDPAHLFAVLMLEPRRLRG
ncbi:hypothetical protein ACG33_12785 [Steroidobacter denitrificans]|uniref:Histidine-specific methyltransferase SAM-dependent domain-containing protein n=1 Tax=Steroidobacter denitrificans TaxID=465721 RepID=A0A127FC38_STEDE|nr:L-histidine N(alpha)-methyltransferase [Steroidobacter denitrificans]AMN47956.1 hypothetical protein ACG33_12785 [Steroidobacter denitrificans]